MKKIQKYLLTALAALLLTGCDELVSKFATPDSLDVIDKVKPSPQAEVVRVHRVDFSEDHKTFAVTTRMYGDIGPYSLTDTTKLRVEVSLTNNVFGLGEPPRPRLIKMRNIKSDNIAKNYVEVLALVDLTQSKEVLERIHTQLVELRSVFNDSNLQVAFIYGDSISMTRPATDYVLNRYLVAEDTKDALLYRAISTKYDEMQSHKGAWAKARRMALLVFSDDVLYNNETNLPIDLDHYRFEEALAQRAIHPDPNMIFCYASMKPTEAETDDQDFLMLKHLCEQTKGLFMRPYSGTDFKNCLLDAFHISPDANEFVFENPDGKVYCGNFESLTVKFFSLEQDTLVTSFHTLIKEGNIYKPIIVNGLPKPVVVLLGITLAAFIAFLIWIVLQLILPFVRYKLFCRKYVVRYTGSSMAIANHTVSESCYLCKEPFEAGDEVVVKCSHTMHKTCWDENEYHCTEYSDRCKEGSHYYNHDNLLDYRNAPYYMKWILVSIPATLLAWILFITLDRFVTGFLVSKVVLWLNGVKEGTPEAASLLSGNWVSPLPTFGFAMGLFLTLAIVILSGRLANVRQHFYDYVIKSGIAAILCYLAFFITNVLVVLFHMQDYAIVLEWMPWVVSSFIIAVVSTYHTRVHLRRKLILPFVIIVLFSMLLWWFFYYNNLDYRIILLIGFIVYGAGLSACVATVAPRTERYFLHVQGAIKEMDIALFKWFRNAPDDVVTIGKSLNCSLQLSWDISGSVAPVQAQIRLRRNTLYLKALEEGVYVNNNPLEVGKEMWMHHGFTFTIANTTFTYIEKDLK